MTEVLKQLVDKLQCTNSNEPNQAGSVFTNTPQRTWVGLTDDDWKEIEDMPDTFDQGVAWAQARLKKKNT